MRPNTARRRRAGHRRRGSLDATAIIEKFIELAGGASATFVIVPTAGGNRRNDGTVVDYKGKRGGG